MKTSHWILVALVALVAMVWLYLRKQAENQQLMAAQVSNPAARGVGYVSNQAAAVQSKIPWIGGYLSTATTAPVNNVLSGDTRSTITSIVTGGVSDFFGW